MKSIKIMSSFNITLIIFLSLSICFYVGDAQVAGYRFVQQWPPAVCSVNSSLCNNIVRRFTIHGLWPYNSNGVSLTNCQGSAYNVALVSEVRAQLDYVWPNFANRPNQDLWKYEWDKHGTCSESILNQTNYFRNSLALQRRTTVLSKLSAQGINPNNGTYSVQAILNAFAYKIQVNCKTNSARDVVLFEIFSCVALTGGYTNCTRASQMNCGGNRANIKFLA